MVYDPNKRHRMKPSAAQQWANDNVGVPSLKKAAGMLSSTPSAKMVKGVADTVGRNFTAAKEAVAADMQATSNFAGRATDSQDEMPSGGRIFKVAAGQQGPDKAESIPNMPPGEQGPDPRQVALEKAKGITTPLEQKMIDDYQQSKSQPQAPGIHRPQPTGASVPSVAEENDQTAGGDIVATDPGQSGARRFGPGAGWIRNEETGDVFAIGPSGNKIVGMNRQGDEISEPTRAFRPAPATEGSKRGYQVAFAPGTPEEEKQAFMRQPGRPGTRMRSGLVRPGEESPRERYFNASQRRREEAESRADARALNESLSDMGVRERIATLDRQAKLQEAGLKADTDITTTGMKESGANTRQFSKNAVDREGNVLDYRVDLEGNRIDQQNADSAESLRTAQAGSYTAETEQKQRLSNLQQEYLQETDPQRKAQLEQEIFTLQGKQPGVPRGELTEKQKIDAKVKLNEEYRKMTEESMAPSDFLDQEGTRPISRELMLYRTYPEEARQLYGEPSPETQIMLQINQSPERWNYFIGLPPEEQQARIKQLVEARRQGAV